MLGMLITGTVLLFCALWECCFKKPKPESDTVHPPDSSESSQEVNVLPPRYEDLDQPPSYAVLYPNFKANEENVPAENSTSSSAEGASSNIDVASSARNDENVTTINTHVENAQATEVQM